MNKEELQAKFEKSVEYLKRNIPPDDIYIFSEQTFMAALFFLKKWSDWEDHESMMSDPIAAKWIRNIMGLLDCQEKEIDLSLDLNLDKEE